MGWVITKDLVASYDIPPRVGIGNGDIGNNPVTFRLFDDDGVLYYEGEISANDLFEGDESLAFAPLDFATADAGCTEMKYLKNGAWETL